MLTPRAFAATAYGWNLRIGERPHFSTLLENFMLCSSFFIMMTAGHIQYTYDICPMLVI